MNKFKQIETDSDDSGSALPGPRPDVPANPAPLGASSALAAKVCGGDNHSIFFSFPDVISHRTVQFLHLWLHPRSG